MGVANATSPPPGLFGNFSLVNDTNATSFPPPPSPPPPDVLGGLVIGPDTKVTDANLRSAVVVDCVLGAFFMLMFVIAQSQSVLYKLRLTTRSVSVKPPPLPIKTASATWAWLVAALMTSDQDLVESCGLDALMFMKLFTYGIQLLFPVALFSVCVLLPIHLSNDFLASDTEFGNQATFMKTTLTNIHPGDPVLWVHTVFVFMYITWGCWLLKFHYKQFVTIRHHWLRTGDDVNEWRLEYEYKHVRQDQEPPPPPVLTKLLNVVIKGSIRRRNTLDAPLSQSGSMQAPGSLGQGDAPGSDVGRSGVRPTLADIRTSVVGNSGGGTANTLGLKARRMDRRGTLRRRRASAASTKSHDIPPALMSAGTHSWEQPGPPSFVEKGFSDPTLQQQQPVSIHRRTSGVSSHISLGVPRSSAMDIDWTTTDQELLDILGGEFHRASKATAAGAPRKAAVSADGTAQGAEGEGFGPRKLTKQLARFLSKKPPRSGGGPGPAQVELGQVSNPAPSSPTSATPGVAHSPTAQPPSSHVDSSSYVSSHPLPQSFSYSNPLADPAQDTRAEEVGGGEVDHGKIEVVVVPEEPQQQLETLHLPPKLTPVLEQLEIPSAPETPSHAQGAQPSQPLPDTPTLLETVAQPDAAQQRFLMPQVSVSARYPPPETSVTSPVPLPPLPQQSASMRESGSASAGATTSGVQGVQGSGRLELSSTGSEPIVGRPGSARPHGLKARGMSLWRKMHKRASSSREDAHRQSDSDHSDAQSSKDGSKHDPAELKPNVPELPRWWEGISLTYDPQAVAAERREKKARSGRHKGHTPSGGTGSSKRIELSGSGEYGVLSPSNKSHTTYSDILGHQMSIRSAADGQEQVAGGHGPAAPGGGDHDVNGQELQQQPGEEGKEPGPGAGAAKQQQSQSLWRPSVRLLRTINTYDDWGVPVSVNAQQYAVLVTDVNQNLWNPRKPLWPREGQRQDWLTRLLPASVRSWILNDYALQALSLYDDTDEEEELEGPEEGHFSNTSKVLRGSLEFAHHSRTWRSSSKELRVSKEFSGSRQGSEGGRRSFPSDTGTHDYHGVGAGGGQVSRPGSLVQTLVQGVQGVHPHHHHHHHHQQHQQQQEGSGLQDGPGDIPLPTLHIDCVPVAVAGGGGAVGGDGGVGGPGNGMGQEQQQQGKGNAPGIGVAGDGQAGGGDAVKGAEERQGGGQGGEEPGVDDAAAAARRQAARNRWQLVKMNIHKILKLPLSASRYSVVTSTFKQMFPDDFDRAIPILPHKTVDILLMRLDWHEQQYTNAVRQYEHKGVRPQGRTSCFGAKIDLIDHHIEMITQLQEQVKTARKQVHESGYAASWLVFFKRQQAAAMCCGRVFHSEDIRDFNVHPAPGPEEVNWPALWMSYHQRDSRSWWTNSLLLLLIILPVGIVTGAAMQVEFLFCPLIECRNTLTGDTFTTRAACDANSVMVINNGVKQAFRWNWYCDKDSFTSQYLTKFITGWLPSLLLMLWQNMVLPISMLMLSQAGGRCLSFSMLDMQVAKYMFWYNLFQSFLGGVLGSAFVQQVNALFEAGPGQTIVVLGSFLPASSNFFMAYMLLRTLVMVPMRMFIPHLGIRMYWFRRYMFRWGSAPPSSREYAIMYQKTSLRIGFEVGMTLLMLLIPMTYAVLAPMMPVLGLGFFLLSWVCWRYAILYIYIRKYESGGMLWPHVCARMLIIFGCFGVFTACVLVVKQAYTQAILLLVLVPIGLAQFNRHMSGDRFQTALEHVPLTMASHAPPATVDPTCYIPPPLIPGSRIWHPEWAKPWQGWNLPIGYSVT